MEVSTSSDVSPLDPYSKECSALRAHPHNVLLEGPVAATNAFLLLLQPHIGEPIVWHRPHTPLKLPIGNSGALVLMNVAALSADDQARLLVWLCEPGSCTQVVSTTELSLFALVKSGLFDAALYYRLNVMLLHVGASNRAEVQEDDAEDGRQPGCSPPSQVG